MPRPQTRAAKTPGAERKRRTRVGVTASEMAAADANAQALQEAETDPATAALLAPVTGPEFDEALEEGEEELEVDLASVPAPPDLPNAKPAEYVPAQSTASVVPVMIRHQRGKVYGPHPTRHMSEMGPVCTSNWIGNIGGNRVSVRYGAPLSTIPMNVRAELAKSPRIRFAIAPPPEVRGSFVVDPTSKGPPRARRSNPQPKERERDTPQLRSRFTPIRQLPVE